MKAKWIEYKEQRDRLEEELKSLLTRPAKDDEVVAWLLESASTFVKSAGVIISMRERAALQEKQE